MRGTPDFGPSLVGEPAEPKQPKPKLLVLALVALLAAPCLAGISDSPEPTVSIKGEGIPGTAYGYDGIGRGVTAFSEVIELDELDAFGQGGQCNAAEYGACSRACDRQVQNPFCAAFSDCETTGGGTVQCLCSYLCARVNGRNYRPDERWLQAPGN